MVYQGYASIERKYFWRGKKDCVDRKLRFCKCSLDVASSFHKECSVVGVLVAAITNIKVEQGCIISWYVLYNNIMEDGCINTMKGQTGNL